jgi:CheY-like chemotaxis protein
MLRVLVVDDDRDTAHSMRTMLKLWGHVVVTARNGATAVKAAEHFGPDVVLLDICMPGMDGYEVARQIRQLPGKQPVIICISGYARDEDGRKAREAGCDHFFAKPADPEMLQRLLQAVEAGSPPAA